MILNRIYLLNLESTHIMSTRKFGSVRIDCPMCSERVYPLESVQYEGITYHKGCMKCTHCKGKLSIKAVAVIGGQLYCKPHFVELFKSGGGNYDNFASPTPSPKTMASEPEEKPLESVQEIPSAEDPKDPVVEEATAEPEDEEAAETERAPTPALKKEPTPPPAETEFSSFKLKSSAQPKGGDIFRDLKMRNLDSLKKTVESGGVETLFQTGSDGVTPIEYAFKGSNQECGRFMIQYLQDYIKTDAGLVK